MAVYWEGCLYSAVYADSFYEYRHVSIPKERAALVQGDRLMTEHEWRSIGIQQSPGWQHYMIHRPEPHIILFRRPLPSAQVPPKWDCEKSYCPDAPTHYPVANKFYC